MSTIKGTVSNDTMTIFSKAVGASDTTIYRDILEYKTIWGGNYLAKRDGNALWHAPGGDWSKKFKSNAIDTISLGSRLFLTINDEGQYVYPGGNNPALDTLWHTNWDNQDLIFRSQGNTFVQSANLSGDFTIDGGQGNDNLRVYGGDQTILGGQGNDTLIDTGLVGMDSINYISWNGTRWSARREGDKFIHAPNGDWSKAHSDTIINYRLNGQNWTAKLDGDNFVHAQNGDWNNSHSDSIMIVTDWSNAQETVSLDGNTFTQADQGFVNYVSWDGSHWSVKREGNQFIHAPNGDWSKAHSDTIIKYKSGGANWTARIEGNQFMHAPGEDWNRKFPANYMAVTGWNGIVQGVFLEGNTFANIVQGNVLKGGDGHDTMHVSGSNSMAYGESGADLLYGGEGTQTLIGGTGSDKLVGSKGNDTLKGGDGNDLLYGDYVPNQVEEYFNENTLQVRYGMTPIRYQGVDGKRYEASIVFDDTGKRVFHIAPDGDWDRSYKADDFEFLGRGGGSQKFSSLTVDTDFWRERDIEKKWHDISSLGAPVLKNNKTYDRSFQIIEYLDWDGNLSRAERTVSDTPGYYQNGRGVADKYDLILTSLNSVSEIPQRAKNQVFLAKIDQKYHVRVFGPSGGIIAIGERTVNKGNGEISFGEKLAAEIEAAFGRDSIDNQTKDNLIEGIFTSLGGVPVNVLFVEDWLHRDSVEQPGFGNDFLSGGFGRNTLDGGGGVDTADYTFATSVNANLQRGTATGEGFNDTLKHIENINGSQGADQLIGDGQNNVLRGLAGNDTIMSNGGNDRLEGGAGDDVIYITADTQGSQSTLVGGQGADKFFVDIQGDVALGLNLDTQRLANFVQEIQDPKSAELTDVANARLATDIFTTGLGIAGNFLGPLSPVAGYLNTAIKIGAQFGFGKMEAQARKDAIDATVKRYGNSDWGTVSQTSRSLATINDFVIGEDSIVLPGIASGSNVQYQIVEAIGTGATIKAKIGTANPTDILTIKNQYDGMTNAKFTDLIGDLFNKETGVVSVFSSTPIERFGPAVEGTHAYDYIVGKESAQQLYGGYGSDVILGNGGDDTIYGGIKTTEGENVKAQLRGLYMHDGNDILSGGAGNDKLFGETGDDLLNGGLGNDELKGGAGADKFVFASLSDGIDIIKDFSQPEKDIIQIDSAGFGGITEADKDKFQFNATTGSLSFKVGQNAHQFATLENVTASGFSVENDIVLV